MDDERIPAVTSSVQRFILTSYSTQTSIWQKTKKKNHDTHRQITTNTPKMQQRGFATPKYYDIRNRAAFTSLFPTRVINLLKFQILAASVSVQGYGNGSRNEGMNGWSRYRLLFN